MEAFWVSSKLARPDTISTCPDSGSRRSRTAQPTTLSTALCRPTSSRARTSPPSTANSPAACSPPVVSKVRCALRSAPGSPTSVAGATVAGSAATGNTERVRTASMLALPHTPQELVV